MKKIITLLLSIITLSAHAQFQVPAFPGAEGHGRYVTGGRGGKIVHVTNLNDSGAGSFRAAVSGNEKKIVVFDVGGVIPLNSNVNIGANTTIMGQTAPKPGITLRYYTVNPAGNNIIMRFIRIRRGSEKNVNDGADASTARHYTGLMIDHCSFSWSIDEVASFYDNNNFTMQWCTVGESLNNAGHDKGAHGYGGIWGGKLASFHHNLILHVNNRSPRFNGARYNWNGYTGNLLYSQYKWENAVQAENVDFRNCVVYNCGNGCYGGPGGGKVNMVGNFYKTGPAATTTRLTTVTVGAEGNAEGYPIYWDMTSRYFLDNNKIDNADAGWNQVSYDNGTILQNGERYSKDPNHYNGNDVDYLTIEGTDYVRIRLEEPGPIGEVTTHDANMAYERVLAYAGASLYRDDVDERYAEETKNGTATYSGSITLRPGRIDLVSDVNGYTETNFDKGSRSASFDTDKDGIPNYWEQANGLDANNAADAKLTTLDPANYYTNIEVYCNSLVQDIMLTGNEDATDPVKEYYPAYYSNSSTFVDAINEDVVPTPDNTQPNSNVTASGTITWPLNNTTATQAEVSNELVNYLSADAISVGSNFTIDKVRSGLMLDFKATSKESSPADSNALTFAVTASDGYLFQPTNIAFYTQRGGTDSGVENITWYGNNTSTVVDASLEPDRSSYTQYSKALSGIAPCEGRSALVINIFQLNATKAIAIGNVVMSGNILTEAQAAITSPLESDMTNTAYYNLQGMRLHTHPVHGPAIMVTTLADGKRICQKINF